MPISVPALRLDQISVSYGHVLAVDEVSLELTSGETTALIGPNGAGKTTMLRAISNQLAKDSGRILRAGKNITKRAPHRIARDGIAHVPEGRHVIAPLTVHENLLLSSHASHRVPRGEVSAECDRIYDLFTPLARLRGQPAGLLSGGEQQMVAIGRALVTRPEVLLLDEPSMGLAPTMGEVIYTFLSTQRVSLRGAAVLLAEQNRLALDVADHAAILSRGELAYSGSPSEIDDDIIKRAYFGSVERHGTVA